MINQIKNLAIIGLGYVGLPLAVEFGKKYSVIGFDINKERIDDLRQGVDKTLEVSQEDLISSSNLIYSSDEHDLKNIDVFIITVPTPIDKYNKPDLTPLISATKTVSKFLKKGSIVVYESTVYPGCTEEICVPVLENLSKLKLNKDFFCGYSPERINPGDKINTITKIKKITSGSSFESAKIIDNLYSSIITVGTYMAPSIKVAEAAKIIENTQRDLNIALINELSVLFCRLGVDTLEVIRAAETKWNFISFKPGMVGGHCIGVDPYYLTFKAEEVGYHPQIIAAGRRMNDNMARYAARNIIKLMTARGLNVSKSKIGVLGFTFKENCPDIRNTKIFDLIKEFKEWGLNVLVSDCYADPDEVKKSYNLDLLPIEDLKNLDALVVAVGHNRYRNMKLLDLKLMSRQQNPILADLKGLYDKSAAEEIGFSVFRL